MHPKILKINWSRQDLTACSVNKGEISLDGDTPQTPQPEQKW
ncbi:MAG: hypothetical protein U5L10_03475 [Candidatus Moranbacteria bacterium]|nr:hypothetical protein [Candidatus Moranbacteria bacterium]